MTLLVQQRLAGLILVAAAVAALGCAWYVQHVMGIVPCELCLLARWPWRVVLVLGVAGCVLPYRAGRWAAMLSLPVLAVSVAIAVAHVGVEQHWWPSPFPSCRAPEFHPGSFRERLASMPLRPSKPCDAATYLWGLPLSMAALSGLFALVVAGLAVLGLRQSRVRA
ncbi:disulfide bond formation protein B [Acidomonas methanolica]|uniref:disulfide bond formation protein B n=1 Tax=Acidomonas methanolica TaxID=437 RepID=UPI00211A9197|nr:disulfide bond formation protein B [Acidomonas methanolica]MCQ9155399.1 disulfide bond formation protein B [Acidomonas methanolica]